ncbi:hypothetical protein [Aureivirga marina]|uniref:hypothetical protein n=1 Tax=Aureivirga marina TaxID=1182451 RepID=UPI0018C90E2F|nr:hypothetical protein [Aureivirga marina]
MALPKKKGIRKITIDSTVYYFKVDLVNETSEVKANIGLEEKPNRRFSLWAENVQITPSIIAESILFMNRKTSWQSESKNYSLKYSEENLCFN